MIEKYAEYMQRTFPQSLYGQWNQCVEFCKKMQADFPELVLKRGYVYSHQNVDNSDPRYPKQYPHFWLETFDGIKVDPTVLQFSLLGELHYVEIGDKPYLGNCSGCGVMCFEPKYGEDGLECSKCHWTS